jgi:hypothetical protein
MGNSAGDIVEALEKVQATERDIANIMIVLKSIKGQRLLHGEERRFVAAARVMRPHPPGTLTRTKEKVKRDRSVHASPFVVNQTIGLRLLRKPVGARGRRLSGHRNGG